MIHPREDQEDPLAAAMGHMKDLASCKEHESKVGQVSELLVQFHQKRQEEEQQIREQAYAEAYARARAEFTQIIDENAQLKVRVSQLEHENEVKEKRAVTAEEKARRDDLTHLLNNTSFTDEVERFCFDALRDKRDVEERRSELAAYWFIDLDRFKAINDLFGHPFGDSALVRVADVLRTGVRQVNIQHAHFEKEDLEHGVDRHGVGSRLGGDEFAVLQVRMRRLSEAYEAASRVKRTFAEIDWGRKDVNSFRPTLSIGVAILRVGTLRGKNPGSRGFDARARGKAKLIKTQWKQFADKEMYKNKHRNNIGVVVLEYRERRGELVPVPFEDGGPKVEMLVVR